MASRLCPLCLDFTETLGTDGAQFFKFKHHQTFASLEAAASKECDLCALLLWTIMRNAANEGYAESDALVLLHEHDSEGFPPFILVPLLVTQESDERRQLWYGLEHRRVTVWVAGWNTDEESDFKAWATLSISPCNDDTPYIVGRIMKVPWDIAICRAWIDECSRNHAECVSAEEPTLPTRVLQISTGASHPEVKLVETYGLTGKYITLSYCWGSARPYCTTRATYTSHLAGISWTELPQLYRDVIEVTQTLGYAYIWIDALAIIQDSKEDWQHESSLMDMVYERSALNTNFPGASDTEHGMLSRTTISAPQPCEIQSRGETDVH
ncbi:hypothetical protein LTR10_002789 [Elasticomyces elasticus]|nr:hypothetical protein LTR10_002789 [Elasticomyces elasticus]KAK4967871.1 hypothetical protein LTR42_010199 [Elasticomyces elasticus]